VAALGIRAFNLARRGASKPTTGRRQKCLSRSR
jgi:hypothetical protein